MAASRAVFVFMLWIAASAAPGRLLVGTGGGGAWRLDITIR